MPRHRSSFLPSCPMRPPLQPCCLGTEDVSSSLCRLSRLRRHRLRLDSVRIARYRIGH